MDIAHHVYKHLRLAYDLLLLFVRSYPGTRKRDDRYDGVWRQLQDQLAVEVEAARRWAERSRDPRLKAWVARYVAVLDRYPIYYSWNSITTPYRARAQEECVLRILPGLAQVLRALEPGGLGAAPVLPPPFVVDPKDRVSATKLGAGVQYMPGAKIDQPGLVVVVESPKEAATSGGNQWWKGAVVTGLTQFLSIAVLAVAGRAWAKANLPSLGGAPPTK